MEWTYRYYDFCIPFVANKERMIEKLDELVDYGYSTIAIDQIFEYDDVDVEQHRGAEVFPEPVDIKDLLEKYKNTLRIFQRLTIVYNDPTVTQAMSASQNLKKYRIIAGMPLTEAALKHCCKDFNGDLITFNPSRGHILHVPQKLLKIALQRQMYFELMYSLILTDPMARRDFIRLASSLRLRDNVRNIIISSGAVTAFELRGPYDVRSLSFAFGFNNEQGKAAIDKTCRLLFMRASARRIGKTFAHAKDDKNMNYSDTSDEADADVFPALPCVRKFRNMDGLSSPEEFEPVSDHQSASENVHGDDEGTNATTSTPAATENNNGEQTTE